MNTCTNKASPRIRFIQYFVWDALRKMFCPNFKSLYRVFDKILKRWQKLWSRRRTGKKRSLRLACIESKARVPMKDPSRGMPPGKIVKSGPLRVHFQHSGAKIRVFFWCVRVGGGGNFQVQVK